MREVVLIGDSIRMGYLPHVERELSGYANVGGPEVNGGTSVNVLAHLDEWVISRKPDVVHVNAGLHDIRRPLESAGNIVAIDDYTASVRQILATITDKTNAHVIWASTTPVNEAAHNKMHVELGDFQRLAADVEAYNEAAADVASGLGIEIHDLYGLVVGVGADSVLTEDGVHYTDDGYSLLGKAVADTIRATR
jgi:lysophospholipase L1-like esterase